MRKTMVVSLGVGALVILSGCAEPGESTKMGAIAGGAVGAGLGALVGSASGDAGTGLLLGATAGAGTGAFVGNAFDAQNEAMRAQDEALERQERMLAAQQREVEELRRLESDLPSDSRAALRQPDRMDREVRREVLKPMGTQSTARGSIPAIPEQSVAVQRMPQLPSARIAERELPSAGPAEAFDAFSAETAQSAALVQAPQLRTPECEQAAGEIERMHEATETADRLFHVRRALRLCPDNAEFHVELGRVYLTLNRGTDAEFEFKEALRLDPSNQAARAGLAELKDVR